MKKISLLLKVALTFLFAGIISFNLIVDRAMAKGNFSQTCFDVTINGSVLSAQCEKINGSYQPTSINLDAYIGNLNGVLSWGDRNFSLTCADAAVAQSLSTRQLELAAKCEKADGYTLNQSDISLDTHIANIDGTLKYE